MSPAVLLIWLLATTGSSESAPVTASTSNLAVSPRIGTPSADLLQLAVQDVADPGADSPKTGRSRDLPVAEALSFRNGFYGKISAGVTQLFDGDLDREQGGAIVPGDAQYDAGIAYSGAFGYRWGNGFALEAEGIYRRNEIDSLEVAGVDTLREGDFASLTFYLNGLYHFDTGTRWRPYVGVGFGWVEEIDVDIDAGTGEFGYDDSGWGYQAMVGVEYETKSGLGVFTEARLFGATGFDLESEDGTGVEYDGDYMGMSLMLGVTYRF